MEHYQWGHNMDLFEEIGKDFRPLGNYYAAKGFEASNARHLVSSSGAYEY